MKLIFVLALLLSVKSFAQQQEVTSVMGSPEMSLDFTNDFIKQEINLLDRDDKPEKAGTTASLYVVKTHGAESAISVAVTNSFGGSTASALVEGFMVGAQYSNIVYTNLGPITDYYCDDVSKMTEVVFVFAAGSSGERLDPDKNPKCKAKNILFVTGLDQSAGDLFERSNYGPYVRVAAASKDIKTIGLDGEVSAKTGATLGLSIVVGKLAKFSRDNPSLLGEKLVTAFLEQKTTKIEKISDRIPGGLAVLE